MDTEDWRLRTQERYLMGVTLSRKNHPEVRGSLEHDHCDFCMKKIGFAGEVDFGYTTKDNYHWICDECFADFKSSFKWKLEEHS